MAFSYCVVDYLDSSNNKRALTEAEKVLKKQKNLQCAKVRIYGKHAF